MMVQIYLPPGKILIQYDCNNNSYLTNDSHACAVFGDGCGTAAGAGLIDEVVLGCARGDTAAPEFTFLPRALCKC